jgi:Tfp pilus assembly protein PilE
MPTFIRKNAEFKLIEMLVSVAVVSALATISVATNANWNIL